LTLEEGPLAGIALAISAYRSDESVLRLLRKAFAEDQPRFAVVIVVDSQGSGAIQQAAENEDWPVTYINSETNLGSAGNLDLRLRTAADLGLKWCLTLNHDGELDPAKVRRLAEHGETRPRVGAVYPQMVFPRAGGRPDSPRRSFAPYTMIGRDGAQADGCVEVAWSSSNGALYNLTPIRDGVTAWPHLWMGYEDLAIGWDLQRRGWVQLLCKDVTVADDYEFRVARILGRTVHVVEKPSWYAYYQTRNLVLIARRSGGSAIGWGGILVRTAVDLGMIIIYRDHKSERLRLLWKGLADGLRGVAGQGPVP
jgi:glycosyltransferase involved in cell wall biosynthesis